MMNEIFPILKVDDLILRQIIIDDLPNIFSGLSNPAIIKYYGVSYNSLDETQEQMEWFAALEKDGTGVWWAIVNVENKMFLGAVGLNNLSQIHKKAEIGFWLLPAYWGKGVMKKAIELVCNYAFAELNLHRIEALVETENINSKKILIKSNFNYEGTMVDCEIKNGNFISLESYAKLH